MQILDRVYKTNKLKYKSADIKLSLRRRQDVSHLFIIVQNLNCGGRVEFFNCAQFYQYADLHQDMVIIGFAESKSKAVELIASMTEEAVRERGNADLSAYLSEVRQAQKAGDFTWL